jgi:hypothetical protein
MENPRNFRGYKVGPITQPWADTVLTFIHAEYAGQRNAAKLLARDCDATPRAAENWLAGLNRPSVDHIVNLLALHPNLEASLVADIAARRTRLRDISRRAAAASSARLASYR